MHSAKTETDAYLRASSEDLFTVESDPDAKAVIVHFEGTILFANRAARDYLGLQDRNALVGESLFDYVHPDWHARICGEPGPLSARLFDEQVWISKDGTRLFTEVETNRTIYRDTSAVQLVLRDITRRNQTQRLQTGQSQILHLIARRAPLPKILHAIEQLAQRLAPHCACSIELRDTTDTSQTDTTRSHKSPATSSQLRHLAARHQRNDLSDNDVPNGSSEHTTCSSWTIFGKNQRLLGMYSFRLLRHSELSTEDLNLFATCAQLAGLAIEHHAEEAMLRRRAYYDDLTALPNRFYFNERLNQALANARRNGHMCAVLFIDLDKFKEVNDRLGHDAGDLVLREVATRLKSCLRHTDMIARMGGDEFYVLIDDLIDADHAMDIAQKLLGEALRPFRLGHQECRLSASIGIAIYPDDGAEAQTLLKNADRAMFRVKESGKNGMQFWSCSKEDRVAAECDFK